MRKTFQHIPEDLEPQQYGDLYYEEDVPIDDVRKNGAACNPILELATFVATIKPSQLLL